MRDAAMVAMELE